MPVKQVGVGVESDRAEIQTADVLKNFVDVAAHCRLAAGDVYPGRSATQNLEHFNGPGRVQALLSDVGIHVARSVIAVGAAKVALHRDVKPGDHGFDQFFVGAAAVARLEDVGDESENELIGNSAHSDS